jgi:hypothetical protein
MEKIHIQELAIVIAVKQLDPTLVTPDFLKYSRIVPNDWEVVGEPIRSFQGSQITFQNGISVIAQPQRISFAELIVDREPSTVLSPQLAGNLTDVLANLNYIGIGINFRGYISFGTDKRKVREFIFQNLLAPGGWQQLGNAPVQAGINLGYTFEERRLNLTINEATLQVPEQEANAIALFSGNFDYDLAATAPLAVHPQRVKQIIGNWERDLELYKDVVSRFMLPAESVIPFPALS